MARAHTPIVSEDQATAMRLALAAKHGHFAVEKLQGPARQMYDSMSEAELSRHVAEWNAKHKPKEAKSAATK